MENYDQRRRQEEERRQSRHEDRGRDRDLWSRGERAHDDEHPRRAERGWLDYDRDYGRPDERQGRREEQREPSRFSPDWSRDGEEPRYSDDPYYSRNRERDPDEFSRRGRFGGRQGDDPRGRDVQRSSEDEQGSHYRGYYSRSATPFSYAGGTGYLYAESLMVRGPYTGRGPKGYKRSDQQIIEEACQLLERDGEIDASDIEVSAEDGVIRLRGTVHDRRAKRRAEECVESIYGARDVMNELRIEQQGGERAQGRQASQDAQAASQSGRAAQASQTSAQGTQGSQASPGSQTSTLGTRPGAGSSTSDQLGDEKRTPRH